MVAYLCLNPKIIKNYDNQLGPINILNKTKYTDNEILSTIAYIIKHMDDRIWKEIVEKQLYKAIAFKTKTYIGVNFVF